MKKILILVNLLMMLGCAGGAYSPALYHPKEQKANTPKTYYKTSGNVLIGNDGTLCYQTGRFITCD